ncbi:group III truncated hemoglobin [Marinoscillum furvescens]|nr:group III truncated hemoglobin [Marinoscillum furvescens]
MKSIESLEDIKMLVDTFYGCVRKDELLGPIFSEKLGDHWENHLTKMYSFWQTVLLGTYTYSGRPFPPHAQLPVDKQHFERWLALFEQTVDELFEGEKADEAKWRAHKMAEMFQYKIAYLREHQKHPLH